MVKLLICIDRCPLSAYNDERSTRFCYISSFGRGCLVWKFCPLPVSRLKGQPASVTLFQGGYKIPFVSPYLWQFLRELIFSQKMQNLLAVFLNFETCHLTYYNSCNPKLLSWFFWISSFISKLSIFPTKAFKIAILN